MSITDTWSLTKLTRAFDRYFYDERDQLPIEVVTAGEHVRSHLCTIGQPSARRVASIRAAAIAAIDVFLEARKQL